MNDNKANSNKEEYKRTYITKSEVKKRGWTDTVIDKWLVVDHEETNPMYKRAAPMKLYLLEDVEKFEQTDEFKEWFKKKQRRASSYEKAVETKREKTFNFCLDIIRQITPPKRLSIERIKYKAIESYNRWHELDVYDYNYVTDKNADKSFLNRICTNYIRHNMMSFYDEDTFASKGMTGTRASYFTYKKAVMRIIFGIYPEFEYDWESYHRENYNVDEFDCSEIERIIRSKLPKENIKYEIEKRYNFIFAEMCKSEYIDELVDSIVAKTKIAKLNFKRVKDLTINNLVEYARYKKKELYGLELLRKIKKGEVECSNLCDNAVSKIKEFIAYDELRELYSNSCEQKMPKVFKCLFEKSIKDKYFKNFSENNDIDDNDIFCDIIDSCYNIEHYVLRFGIANEVLEKSVNSVMYIYHKDICDSYKEIIANGGLNSLIENNYCHKN